MVKKAKVASHGPQATSRSRNADERCTSNGDGYMDESDNDGLQYCSITETRSIHTTHEIIDEIDFSDSSEPQYTEPPSKKNPKKRKRTEEEWARRKPDVFHYDGATTRNMSPKIVYPQDRIIMNRLTTRPWIREAKAAAVNELPSYLDMMEDEDGFGLGEQFWSFSPRVAPMDTMPLKDRKRFFIYTPTSAMVKAMRATVSDIHGLFSPIKNIGDCMLHPYPPPLRLDGGMRGRIIYLYRWKDDMGNHVVQVNYGVVALLVNSRLTNTQKEGWIEDAWHLSHLCGNWICCNWRHHTIEDGPTNVSRNGCFGSSKECIHKPPCMKEKKQKLVLPAHRSKRTQLVVPGMTDDDVNEVDAETSESDCATDCECRNDAKGKEAEGDGKGTKKQGYEDEENTANDDDEDSDDDDFDGEK